MENSVSDENVPVHLDFKAAWKIVNTQLKN